MARAIPFQPDPIQSYNSGSRTIQQFFEDLVIFSRGLNEEEQRHVRENLSEPELTVFDLLTRPGPNLSDEEREEAKKGGPPTIAANQTTPR